VNDFFPLIRHFSIPVSKILIRLPVTPNQVTTASLAIGLWSCWYFLSPTPSDRITGSLLFLLAYILDNCDGEVARHLNMASDFGEKYDTFVDWVVHSCFFAALGFGIALETNNNIFLWLGLAGSIGGTINYLIPRFLNRKNKVSENLVHEESKPKNTKDFMVYVFRELFRADFCFIVLVLTPFNLLWLILIAGAIGAQVYWIMYFMIDDN
jgi:phosphatidylglycerophosphate synthase